LFTSKKSLNSHFYH